MPQSPNDQLPTSDYPQLELPEGGFKSNIPEYLLKDSDPQMKWLMEKMSENTQMTEWTGHGVLDTNIHVRHTNGRLKLAEKEILRLKQEVIDLTLKLEEITPIANAIKTSLVLLTNKIFLIFSGLSILFLLGYHRDIIPALFHLFFG